MAWLLRCLGLASDLRPATDSAAAAVSLDIGHAGQDTVIVKAGRRVCGTGACLASAPLVQNKSYWEIKLQTTGVWGLGVALRTCTLDNVPLGTDIQSWVLRSDGTVFHGGQACAPHVAKDFEDGDILACAYDHSALTFFLNGEPLDLLITGIKGCVFPVFYVDEGAILDVNFNNFMFTPPMGCSEIMVEKRLL